MPVIKMLCYASRYSVRIKSTIEVAPFRSHFPRVPKGSERYEKEKEIAWEALCWIISG